MHNMKLAVGVDIGGTNTVFGLVDKDGDCIAQKILKTADYPIVSEFVATVSKEVNIQNMLP